MDFSIYDASVPVFTASLTGMAAWLDKAAGHDEPTLIAARLAPDMRPLTAQFQMASDTAKNAVARLIGDPPPPMPDTEAGFAELKNRCTRTIDYIRGVDPARFAGAEDRAVVLPLPGGREYRFIGATYLTGFALPNFFFHVGMAYAILRHAGVPLGKPDYLAHLGPPDRGS